MTEEQQKLSDRIEALEKRHARLKTRGGRLQEELIDVHRELAEVKLAFTVSLEKTPIKLPGMK